MSIKVRYFASLSDLVGKTESEINYTDSLTVADVWKLDTEGRILPANLLAAVNMEYAGLTDLVTNGDEVAFFPPVTGG